MSETLIPYSFVPGTKAMAGEINANFIALANAVDDAKNFTTNSIAEFNTEFENCLDEYEGKIENKLSPDMSNSCNISNCVLATPKTINYTLTSTSLTIGAGTIILVPYGVENLSTNYPTGTKFLNDNFQVVETAYCNGKFFVRCKLVNDIVYSTVGNNVANINRSLVIDVVNNRAIINVLTASGSENYSTTSNAQYYHTGINKVQYFGNGVLSGTTLSLPLMRVISTATFEAGSIGQVFDGMGYIGSSFWVDKGLKGLAPNGLNSDGTRQNFLYKTSGILTCNVNLERAGMKLIVNTVGNGSLTWGNGYVYDETANILYHAGNNSQIKGFVFAIATSNANAEIVAFNPCGVLKLASTNDLTLKADISLTNVFIDYSSPVNISSGWTATKAGVVYYNLMTDTSVGTGTVSVDGVIVVANIQTGANRNHHEIGGTLFISPGQVLTTEGTVYSLIFYPFK